MIGDAFDELEQDECVCRVDAAGAIDAGQSQASRKRWDVSDDLQEQENVPHVDRAAAVDVARHDDWCRGR